ncbi:hypothetical protein ABKN59_000180 [Abortiporus biennis]
MGDQTPQLTSTNLRHGDKIDKDQLIRSFIRTQQTYSATYAAEGKVVQASWNREDNLSQKKTSEENRKAVQKFSILSTSILEPRVPLTKTKAKSTKKVEKEVSPISTEENNSVEKHNNSNELSSGTKKPFPESRGHHKRNMKGEARVGKNTDTTQRHLQDKPKIVQSKEASSKKRPRVSDSEHEERLSDRRQRRRAQRAIVNPKQDDAVSAEDNEDEDGRGSGHHKQAGKRKKKTKKTKGVDMVAGLALMHGFAAKNIGADRITLKPTSGLFHKGKASEKNTTESKSKKTTERKKPMSRNTWSEAKFLNQAETRRHRHPRRSPSPSSHNSISDAGTQSSNRSLRKVDASDEKGKKARNETVKGRHKTAGLTDESGSETDPAQASPVARDRPESVVWDIELGHSLGPDSTLSRSLVVDIRNRRWAEKECTSEKEDNCSNQGRTSDDGHRNSTEAEDNIVTSKSQVNETTSTLHPSQSASQVVTHRVDHPQRSRFFPISEVMATTPCATTPPVGNACSNTERERHNTSSSAMALQQQTESPRVNEDEYDNCQRDNIANRLLEVHSNPEKIESCEVLETSSLIHSLDRELHSTAGLYALDPSNISSDGHSSSNMIRDTGDFHDIHQSEIYIEYEPTDDEEWNDEDMDSTNQAFEECSRNLQMNDIEPEIPFYSGGFAVEFGDTSWPFESDIAFDLDLLETMPPFHHVEANVPIGDDSKPLYNVDYNDEASGCLGENAYYTLHNGSEPFGMLSDGDKEDTEEYGDGEELETALSSELEVGGTFSHGKALLLGLSNSDDGMNHAYQSVRGIELDTAKRLKGHWLPQRL